MENGLSSTQFAPQIRGQNNTNDPRYAEIFNNLRRNYEGVGEGTLSIAGNSQNYKAIALSINDTMKDIISTQKTFEMKKKWEENELGKYLFETYIKVINLFGNNINNTEWNELFSRQLRNVSSLNNNLTVIVKGSTIQAQMLYCQLQKSVSTAKSTNDKKQETKVLVNPTNEEYNKIRKEFDKLNPENPEYYDRLKESFDCENKMMGLMTDVALIKSSHSKDMQKIEFLKRHYAFQRGLIFSAKGLAISTKKICDSLEYLLGVWNVLKPMGTCLEAIHQGIGTLKGYTDSLNKVYTDTFVIMNKIESSEEYNILPSSAASLDTMVNQMITNLESKVQ
jgi:hypothetical protein